MRNLTLGTLFVLTSLAAIAYVYQQPSCPCGTSDPVESLSGPEPICTGASPAVFDRCGKCKGGVVDVVDLNTAYAASPATGTPISFDEPPYAKPRDVQPVQFELPVLETAPAPRLAQ